MASFLFALILWRQCGRHWIPAPYRGTGHAFAGMTRGAMAGRPRLNKALGQHLLVSEGVLDGIVEAAELSGDDLVVEVGPGTGLLTSRLLESAGHVIAIEIDSAMVDQARTKLSEHQNLTLIHGDIRDQSPTELTGGRPYVVVANLPYYAASPTIRLFLESHHAPQRMVVMAQREVAQQITASGGKSSLLTIAIQVYADARIVRRVRPGSFVPAPGVESAVVRLDVLPEPRVPDDLLPHFFTVARAGFSAPRKQLRNSLSGGLGVSAESVDAALASVGVDGRRRAETLEIGEWMPLAMVLRRFLTTDQREQS